MTFAKWSLLLFAGLVLAPSVSAQGIQNTDVYFLVGAREVHSQRIDGSDVTLSGKSGYAFVSGCGYQVARFSSAGLWVEFAPAVLNSGVLSASIGGVSSSSFTVYVPTARVMAPVSSRVSLYGTAGYGAGQFEYPVITSGTTPSLTSNRVWHGVFAFGGGVDYRLSRWISVRAETRDYVTGRGLSGSAGRHHVIPLAGIAFHF